LVKTFIFNSLALLALCSSCGDKSSPVTISEEGIQDLDGDGFSGDIDCDDLTPTVYPGADEVCDGIDNNCDGAVDEDAVDAVTLSADADGDGYGDPSTTATACDLPSSGVVDASDCDDARPDIHPGADEICDGVDNNCDGSIDGQDAVDSLVWYGDGDGDGYGADSSLYIGCAAPEGYVSAAGDCDDSDGSVSPGAEELCADLLDNDCDGETDQVSSAALAVWSLEGNGNERNGAFAGSLQGDFSYTEGVDGQAISLASGWLITDLLRPTAGTVAMWFRLDLHQNFQQLFGSSSGQDDFECWLYESAELRCRSLYTALVAELDTWYHVAYTWDDVSNESRVYIDGVDATGDEYNTLSGSGSLFFGADTDKGQSAFVGDLDEVMVFDRSLNEADIQSMYADCW